MHIYSFWRTETNFNFTKSTNENWTFPGRELLSQDTASLPNSRCHYVVITRSAICFFSEAEGKMQHYHMTDVSHTSTDKGPWISNTRNWSSQREGDQPKESKTHSMEKQNAEDKWNMGHTISYQQCKMMFSEISETEVYSFLNFQNILKFNIDNRAWNCEFEDLRSHPGHRIN